MLIYNKNYGNDKFEKKSRSLIKWQVSSIDVGKTIMILVQKSFIGANLMPFPMVSPDAGFFGVPSSQIQAFLI